MKIHSLDHKTIIKLAQKVAKDLGMRSLNEKHLVSKINVDNPIPMIFFNENVMLWVDRYYIAYSFTSELYVHYVYIAPKHAKEEMSDLPLRIQKCNDKLKVIMLKDIQHQLSESLKNKKEFYIKSEYKNYLT